MSKKQPVIRLSAEAGELLEQLAEKTATPKGTLASQIILHTIPRLILEPKLVKVYEAKLFDEVISTPVGTEVDGL